MNDLPWLRREIKTGLQALVALGLAGQPAEDVITLTADIWYRSLSGYLYSEANDVPRIRRAFDQLFPDVTEWPAPRMLIDRLPRRPEQKALGHTLPTGHVDEEYRECRPILEELVGKFSLPPVPDEDARREVLRGQIRRVK